MVLKYLKEENKYEIEFKKISKNIVEIVGDFPPQQSGFTLSRIDQNDNWDYSSYTTIYRELDNGVQFSNDGSVYVEPVIPEPPKPTLEEVKISKINELSNICNQQIIQGVDIEVNGETGHFSYDYEDQVNIKELFDLSVQTNVPMFYHADEESCKAYSTEEIITIYAALSTNKSHHITYYNQLKMYVESLENIDDVKSVVYGQELTGEYLDTYNESMAQAQLVLDTLLTKRASITQE